MVSESAEPVIDIQGLSTRFGSHLVHDQLDLAVRRGEILAIAGGSGSGKSVLLREMILLQKPTAGVIRIFDDDISKLSAVQEHRLRHRWGVMFQHGGLFGSLTVRENVGLPLREQVNFPREQAASPSPANSKVAATGPLTSKQIDGIADAKLALTGLPADAGAKRPDELSGGMLKRASLARAIALDPELLFLDEPTSGLDPASAAGINTLIVSTHESTRSTMVIVTHDRDLMWQVADRVAVLGECRVLAIGTMDELQHVEHPIVQAYFAPSPHRHAPPASPLPTRPASSAMQVA
jgi:phospholipid/cholesterol/gamma-HCH transport system ATP-binding protein